MSRRPWPRPGLILLLRRLLLLLFFRLRLGLALCLGVVRGLVVRRAGCLGDLAHHFPGLLVGDREESIVAVELLLHGRGEMIGEETGPDLLGELGMEVVRIGKRRGREQGAREDDAEIIYLEGSA